VEDPKALAVVYTARGRAVTAVAALRAHWPRAPILARALDQLHAAELRAAGADTVVTATAEAGLELGAAVLAGLSADERRARLGPLGGSGLPPDGSVSLSQATCLPLPSLLQFSAPVSPAGGSPVTARLAWRSEQW